MYKKILIATDGSELAERGVEQGLRLAKTLGAEVVVVSVTEHWLPHVMAGQAQSGVYNPITEYERTVAESARRILERAEAIAQAEGVAIRTMHVPDSHPAEGIIATAEREGSDLIVMASNGRRGASRMLLGSQTAEVVTTTKIPVLVIR